MSIRLSGLSLSPLAALALAVTALSSAPALAQEQGMRVTRDAQTGRVRAPTAEENKTLDEAAARMRAARGQGRVGMASGRVDPQAITHPDGTLEQELDESSLVYTVARRNADGSIEMVCVEGSEAANKALTAPKFASRPTSKVAKEQTK